MAWLHTPVETYQNQRHSYYFNYSVKVVDTSRDLDVVFDSQLSLSAHVGAICRVGPSSPATTSHPVTVDRNYAVTCPGVYIFPKIVLELNRSCWRLRANRVNSANGCYAGIVMKENHSVMYCCVFTYVYLQKFSAAVYLVNEEIYKIVNDVFCCEIRC